MSSDGRGNYLGVDDALDHDCEPQPDWDTIMEMETESRRDAGEPVMLWVAGKRFSCGRCGVTVFTRTPDGDFACNGCGITYGDPGATRTEEAPFL